MKKEIKFQQTEIGNTPKNWEVKPLSGIVEVIGGGTPKTGIDEYWGGDIPWISINDFNNGSRFISKTEKTITEKGLANSSTKMLKKGMLIISARGTVGEIAQLTKDMAFNQSCYGLNGKKGSNNNFLYYLIKNSISKLKNYSYGSVFDTITIKTFDNLEVSFPKNSIEQQAIAQILSKLDEKIELNNKMNKTLEMLGQTIFKRWFVDEKKESWKITKIGKELKTVLGGTPDRTKPEYWNGSINWINSGKVNEFRITTPSEKITEEGLDESATKLLPKNTTVLAVTGATLGQVSRLEINTCANQSVVGIIENEKIPSEFIYFLIKEEIQKIISHQTGGAQQHINKNNVDNFEFLLPDNEVLTEYKKLVRPIFQLISKNCFENQSLATIRDSLLPKLMSGEIRVPLENDSQF